MTVPTFEQVIRHYRIIAAAEQVKTGRPSEYSIANVIRGTKCVCGAAGVPLDSPVGRMGRKEIDSALACFMV